MRVLGSLDICTARSAIIRDSAVRSDPQGVARAPPPHRPAPYEERGRDARRSRSREDAQGTNRRSMDPMLLTECRAERESTNRVVVHLTCVTTFQQSRKEDLYEFFKDPNREKLRQILRGYDSEYDNLDFKQEWIADSKLAKHILAMGNSGGGVIVFGVEEVDGSPQISGLSEIKDTADLDLSRYLPDFQEELHVTETFEYESSDWEELEGEQFQVVFINDIPSITPLVSISDGDGIRESAIYVRDAAESTEAKTSDIDNIVQRRIQEQIKAESGNTHSELQELRALYSHKEEKLSHFMRSISPGSPNEFQRFIDDCIERKEDRIEENLNIK